MNALPIEEHAEAALFETLWTPRTDVVAFDMSSLFQAQHEDGNNVKSTSVVKNRMYRERRRNDKEVLRRQEIELSRELIRVQRAKQQQIALENASRPASFFRWKTVALRQREERLYAEAERCKLIGLVNSQAVYIDTLSGTIRKRLRVDDFAVDKKRRHQETETAMCDAYIRELAANYDRIDEVFQESGMTSLLDTETTIHSAQKRESDGDVLYYQKLSKSVQPFSLSQTASLLWKLVESKCDAKKDCGRYFAVLDPSSMMAFQFHENVVLNAGSSVPILKRFFARSFEEDDRIIHVWTFVSEGDGAFSGLQTVEFGWCCLSSSTDPTAPGTMLETVQRWTPIRVGNTPSTSIEEFYGVMQNVTHEIVNDVMTSLEKLLLEDVLNEINV